MACGLEHVGVHDNMSQIQAQNHQCDGGGCQQGSELTLDKALGANLVVTSGVVADENTTCTLEANHMDHVERSTNTGSQGTRKHRRNLIQVLSDEENEDNVASPPTKKSLIFKTSYEYVAACNATPLENDLQLQELYNSSSTREALRMVAVVGMEFGGGISVTESVTEELQTNGKVIPKYPLNGPRREKTIELLNAGNADVTNDHVEEGLIRSKRLGRLSSSTSTNDHPRTSYKRLSCRGEKNTRNTKYAKGGLEVEDEVECSDKDTNFSIGDSSQASFESSGSGRQFCGDIRVLKTKSKYHN